MVLELHFCGRKPLFGLPYDFRFALKTAIKIFFGYVRNDPSSHKNTIPRQLNNRYFGHITIIKWSRICQNSIRKCFFKNIFLSYPISIRYVSESVSQSRSSELEMLAHLKNISPKKQFLVEFCQIRDHFIIVMWQNYLL